MKKFLAMCLGLLSTLLAVNAWAGTFAPTIERQERWVLDDTFYDQRAQLDQVFASIAAEEKQKVIGLGDSTMYGAVVYQNETIPYFLRDLLQQQTPDSDVYNLAYPGARPADLYAMAKLAAETDPAMLLIDVNVVFFSEKILAEGALANAQHRRAYVFEPDVPKGVFKGDRLEETLKLFAKSTNIGQYEQDLTKYLFEKSPRAQLRDGLAELHPAAEPAAPAAPAEPNQDVIGLGWKEKTWGEKQRQTMERIYGQGPLTEENDSVKMFRRLIEYTQEHDLKTLFYMAPQNEALIGKFFDVNQLRQNEDYLTRIMQEEGAWFLDLRRAVPERDFGDYDHLLRAGNLSVAQMLAAEIAEKGALRR